MSAFVIAAKKKERVGIKDLVAEKEQNAFAAKMTAIHVVAEEQVPLVRRVSADFEQLDQVVELSAES